MSTDRTARVIRFFAGTLLLALLSASCGSPLSPDGGSGAPAESGGAYIRVVQDTGISRTILPSSPGISDFSDFTLQGTLQGKSPSTIATADTYAQLSGRSIRVDAGLWSFTLTASHGGVRYSGTTDGVSVSAGENIISFTLEPDSSATGGFSLSLSFPQDDVTAVRASLVRQSDGSAVLPEEELSVQDGKVLYAKDALSAGLYRITVGFYGGDGGTLFLNSYRELVRIAPGLTGTAERTVSSLNDVYSLSFPGGDDAYIQSASPLQLSFTRRQDAAIVLPGKTEMRREGKIFCGWYTSQSLQSGTLVSQIDAGTTQDVSLYARWRDPVMYIKADGDDSSGEGTRDSPFATVARAVGAITEYEDDGTDFAIHVLGEVGSNTAISDDSELSGISEYLVAKSLTVQGDGAESSALTGTGGTGDSILTFMVSGDVTVKNLSLKGNDAPGGGAISFSGDGTLLLDGCTIQDCTAQVSGGGVYVGDGSSLSMTGTTITGCSATTDGGGVYKSGSGHVTMDKSLVSGNEARRYGGGVYFGGNSASDYLSVTGTTISLNKAVKPEGSSSHGNGGGIYVMAGTLSLGSAAGNGAVITRNEASDYGGGIVTKGSATIRNSTVSGNSSQGSAGGIQVTGSTCLMYDTTVSGNEASSNGGGISLDSATVALSGGTVSGNRSGASGGGVYVGTGCTFSMSGNAVVGNASLSAAASEDTASNKAAADGGGIYSTGTVQLGYENGSAAAFSGGVYGNWAAGNGGGIYSRGTLTASGGSVSCNGAGTGGALGHAGTAALTLSGVTFTRNAASSGGALYLFQNAGDATLTDCVLDGNTASSDGGAVYARAKATLLRTTVKNGSAENGGCAYVTGAQLSVQTETVISGNTASSDGGGVYSGDSGTVVMASGFVSANTADGNGGGIYVSASGTLSMTGGTIGGEANSADGYGNGVYNDGQLNMSGSAYIPAVNDVYLPPYSSGSARLISVTGTLDAETPVATITPSSYSTNWFSPTRVITGSQAQNQCGKFAVTPQPGGVEWKVTWQGFGSNFGVLTSNQSGEIRYIRADGQDSNAPFYGMTTMAPFKTLEYAIKSFSNPAAVDEDGNPTNIVYVMDDYTNTQSWADMTDSFAVKVVGCRNGEAGEPVEVHCNTQNGSSLNLHQNQIMQIQYVTFNQTSGTDNAYAAIMVDSGASLVMSNCTMTGIRGNTCAALHIDGSVALSNVTITGNTSVRSGGWSCAVNVKEGTLTLAGKTVISGNLDDAGNASNLWIGFTDGTTHAFNPLVVAGSLAGSSVGVKHGEALSSALAFTSGYTESGNAAADVTDIFESDTGGVIAAYGGEACFVAGPELSPVTNYSFASLPQDTDTGLSSPVLLSMKDASGTLQMMQSWSYTVEDSSGTVLLSDSGTASASMEIALPPFQNLVIKASASDGTGTATFEQECSVRVTDVWVSTSGSDWPSNGAGWGTPSKPYATLSASLAAINASGSSATVHVTGQISGNADISSVTAGSLTVTGTTGSAADSLNGNNNGTTLTVSTATPVIIKKLKITGGRKVAGDAGNIMDETGYGGGVLVKQGTTVTLGEDCAVTGNTASNGGGVLSAGTLLIAGASISGNTATNGGGICNFMGSLTMTGGSISGNTARKIDGSDQSGAGGGILNWGSCTIAGSETCSVSGNSADYGGGIMNFNGDLTLGDNSEVQGNTTPGGYGSGIALTSSDCTLTMTGSAKVPYTPGASGSAAQNVIALSEGTSIQLGAADLSSDFTALVIPDRVEAGVEILTVANSAELRTRVAANKDKFLIIETGWTIDEDGRLAWSSSGGLSADNDSVSFSLSADTVSASSDTTLGITATVTEAGGSSWDATSSIPPESWSVRVYSGTTDVTQAGSATVTLTDSEKSVTIKQGIPQGTQLTVYVSCEYNMRAYGGSFFVTVE